MEGGYVGLVLEVDLTRDRIWERELSEEDARLFLGGKGLGVRILLRELAPGVDPLSPENLLVFSTGPLTGTAAPTSGRFAVVTKSPLTGLFLDSQVGGWFGPELKRAGFDAVVVRGRADHPVALLV
ncbi:MAG: aldehyde ferredoxin oxidoreductase, partial [Thermoproteota archaeon]